MKISRREAMGVSGSALAGLTLGAVGTGKVAAQPQEAQPEGLVTGQLRTVASLPLNPDGSAVEYTPKEAGTISQPYIWRYTKGKPPEIEFDYRKMKIKIDARRTALLSGMLTFDDLKSVPLHSEVVLLQCGAPNPSGIVKWTGVRFSDFARRLGVQSFAYYGRFVGSDGYFVEEDMQTLMHPQVMLAWLLNDEPIPPRHGAPLRLIIPFRYGARSLKAVQEIYFTATSFPAPEPPSRG